MNRCHQLLRRSREQQQGRRERSSTMKNGTTRNCRLWWLVVLVLLFQNLSPNGCCYAQSDYDEYVKEVLEEDQERYGGDHAYYDEDHDQENLRKQQQQQQRKMDEEERREQEKADRIVAERERAFEKELAKMNADQKKVALRQKKKDAKITKSVLRAAQKGNHYAVLGIHNYLYWTISIPSRTLKLVKYSITIPGLTIGRTHSTKDIRRAYKRRALAVHPDKNRDGNAQQAFVAVENAASILSDTQQRLEYDLQVSQQRKERRDHLNQKIGSVMNIIGQYIRKVIWVFRSVLGPFATPVIIIGAILI